MAFVMLILAVGRAYSRPGYGKSLQTVCPHRGDPPRELALRL